MIESRLLKLSILDVHKSLLKSEISVSQLCQRSLDIINRTNHLNSFVTIQQDEAIKKAKHFDETISANPQILTNNPLFGVPISVKDNFCTKNVLTTCGSKMLHNYIPPFDASAVNRLKQLSCLIMGKTNMDEFAMGSSSTTSNFGPAANCWGTNAMSTPDQWFMAGGSSTGSAVSVATGACFASLGTDTGGSTRQPASLTGVVGFKPTYGLISRYGLVPLAHCLDVVSILARNVSDASLLFEALIGIDENDLTTVDHFKVLQPRSTKKTLNIGIPEQFVSGSNMSEVVSRKYDQIIKQLGEEQFKLTKLDLPNAKFATECYTVISSAEIASNMSCYDGVKYGYSTSLDGEGDFDRDAFYQANRDGGFGTEVKKRILLGNYFLLEQNREKYLVQAYKLRQMISDEFRDAFKMNEIDAILMPSTPTTAVTYQEWLEKQDSNSLFHEDYFLIPSNLANLPSISLPSGLSDKGMPIGMQLIANKFHDRDLLELSSLFEEKILNQDV